MKDYHLIIEKKEDIVKFRVIEPDKWAHYKVPGISLCVLGLSYGVFRYNNTQDLMDSLWIVLPLVMIAILLCRQGREDSMMIIKNIGVQLHSQTHWKFVKSDKNLFVPLTNIIDLVIHEGFYGYGNVIFYMCILTKNTNDNEMIKIVFSQLLPRKEMLVDIWRESRQVMFSGNRHWRRIPGQGLRPVV
ncbi:hypothetical protein CLIB1444_04S09296 [[Candida] jaroonii]|uniref:Uncharacterized protein n=1 Tax=[Candida] jaroonii TaxID=467808 RepID=A0ACA9Y834_9ASCO|nr:hypothetical protein CLIB1444_04S09296 [[Candida] jaroonii]